MLVYSVTSPSQPLVLKMALSLLRLGELVFTQNVLIELHIDTQKIPKPFLDPSLIGHDMLGEIIRINVDTDGADHAKLFPHYRDGRAFKFPAANVQLVVQFILVSELTLFQINQQIGGAITQL